MSQFPEATVSLDNVGGEGQGGIPFAVYPSVLFYQKDLFDEAGNFAMTGAVFETRTSTRVITRSSRATSR